MCSQQPAALHAPELIHVGDVVRAQGLAQPHIVTIGRDVGKAGHLEIKRGRGARFCPAHPAEKIVIAEVIRLTEGPLDLIECFHPEIKPCPRQTGVF